jgi:hypothetical protein
MVFHAYSHPDSVGYAGWYEDASGNVLGWQTLDGGFVSLFEACGADDIAIIG